MNQAEEIRQIRADPNKHPVQKAAEIRLIRQKERQT